MADDLISVTITSERGGSVYKYAATIKSPLGFSYVFADRPKWLRRRIKKRVREIESLLVLQEGINNG